MTASQINITGKHVVCGEGTTEIDVSNNAVSRPLERLHAVPCFVATERSLLLFPVEETILGATVIIWRWC